jgi:ferredoxin-type protein NapG
VVADAADGYEDVMGQQKPESTQRREFFRKALRKTGESIVNHVDAQARQRAAHWIRPPFALDELEFLLECTRCSDCFEACTYQVIFPLPARLGAQVVGTPAMDLLNQSCHLCTDWPCVSACEHNALKLPEISDEDSPPLPTMAVAWIDTALCLPYSGPECGACAASCPVPDALVWDMGKPRINQTECTGCAQCREACIVDPKAIRVKSPTNTVDNPDDT